MQATGRPLTTRIVIAFTLFGVLLAVFMAAFVLGAFVYTERQHVRSLVDGEMSYLRESGRPHAAILDTMSLYQGPAASLREELPPDLRTLGSGVHQLLGPPRLLAVEEAERILRIVSMSLEPIHGRERMERRDADAPNRLAAGHADDEVGALARALDAYEARIRDLLERERRVTDQASHELRTPITVITGAAELLLADQSLPAAARQRVERIHRAAIEMAELVETFLLLAREPQDAAKEPQSERSLAAVVREVVDSQAVWLENKPVRLRLEVEQDAPVRGPERLLAIVVANLVHNACQYTEQGTVAVRVRGDGIDVPDTGPVLGRNACAHALSVRQRETDRRSGVGLALVRALCGRQGWSITLSERAGAGPSRRCVSRAARRVFTLPSHHLDAALTPRGATSLHRATTREGD